MEKVFSKHFLFRFDVQYRDNKGLNFLLQTKSEPKIIGKPIIFKTVSKNGFSIRNLLITIGVMGVWIVIRYFLFEKQSFKGYWYT